MNHLFKKIKIIGLIVFTISYFLLPILAGAQQQAPQFLVSWQTNSFAPSWYQGKSFPTTGSRLNIKFDLIDNGKVADLSKLTVRWYINDNLVINEKNGSGIKSHTFITNNYTGSSINVRISIPNYNGSTLDNVIDIPIASPEVVINNPNQSNLISSGKLNFEAVPFFFNVSDNSNLSFLWDANGQPTLGTGNPFLSLNIDAASGSEISLSILVKNITNELETASKNIKFTVK